MRLTTLGQQAEQNAITAALKTSGGNVAEAARLLDLPLRTVWRRLLSLRILPDDYRDGTKK